MRKISVLKLGFGALIVALTMLGAKAAPAADLCVFQYTLPNGQVCTFVRYFEGCCRYRSDNAATVCPPICGVGV